MSLLPGMPGRPGGGRSDLLHLTLRALVFAFGLFVMAMGIALLTRANLGTSPISAVPFVLSLWGGWSFGMFTFAMMAALVLVQILLLRRRYKPFQLTQLVAGLVFSACIDLTMWMTASLDPQLYWQQALQPLLGTAVLGIGVALQVAPRLFYLPGEGVVVAIVIASGRPFNIMKVSFDCLLVVAAFALSFIFWGELRGVREGTIVAAVLVGFVVGWVMPFVRKVVAWIGAAPPPRAA